MVRGTTNLPYGTGKSRVVWVFARGEKAEDARAAGADVVGAEDLVERVQKEGGANCDLLVASPDMMPLVGRLGQILKAEDAEPEGGNRLAQHRSGRSRHQGRDPRRVSRR